MLDINGGKDNKFTSKNSGQLNIGKDMITNPNVDREYLNDPSIIHTRVGPLIGEIYFEGFSMYSYI